MNRLGRIRCWSPSIALAVFALVVAACGGATAASVAPAPSGAVTVEATEYKFAPVTLTAHSGNVIIRVRNAGTVDHEFEVFQATPW